MVSLIVIASIFFLPVISIIWKKYLSSVPSLKPVGLCPQHHYHPKSDEQFQQENLSCVFSDNYYEARDKFRRAAKAIPGGELHSLDILSDSDPGAYTIDLFLLRSDKEEAGLSVHSSGVHGVEGFAGSAVQIAYLHELASMIDNDQKPDATILLAHAVNPYGMAHFRRFNEHNVDLNRNGLFSAKEWEIETSRDANIAGYEDFSEGLFNPPNPPTIWQAYVGFMWKAIYLIGKHGIAKLKRALVAGQYHNSKGIMFGGKKLEPSHSMLRDFLLDQRLPHSSKSVTWIDVHTGLGPSGIDTLLISEVYKDEIERWFPDLPRPMQDTNGNGDVAGGYDLSKGFMNGFYRDVFQSIQGKSVSPLILTQEFGTLTAVLVARAMIFENMAYNYAPLEDHGWWSHFTRDAFYVRSTEWRYNVLQRGLKVWKQAIRRSSNLGVA